MRDIAEEGGITDTVRFRRFLNACAALVSEQVNYANLAETADVSQPTAKEWVRVLRGDWASSTCCSRIPIMHSSA